MPITEKYDVVIVGSGLGGLLCANLLAMHGKKVCVIEKNKQFGGSLQTFSRKKQLFDTGVHYIGGLSKGQNLYQIFKYLGLIGNMKLKKMDECFDKIIIGNDEKIYFQSQGYKAFVHNLVNDFPHEETNILAYCQKVKDVCRSFPLYNLSMASTDDDRYKGNNESANAAIASFTTNSKLQSVLAGNNILYAGQANKTPFHTHALITNSYIESSWKCASGGSQIAKLLVANIRKYQGEIIRNCSVQNIIEKAGKIAYVTTEDGQTFYADSFISNIHPTTMLRITQSSLLKGLYRNRITNLEQSVSSFSVHIILNPKTIAYENCNYYYHKEGYLWQMNEYNESNWPLGYGLYFTEDQHNPGFAAAISILTPMRFDDVKQWRTTHNRVGKESNRGADYLAFKNSKASKLLTLVYNRFPKLEHNISNVYTSTPLTNRDYIGDETGSMYGVLKDFENPLKTMISPRTKIPNLFLTGQNINLHGILGTSLSAVLTSMMLLDDYSIIEKIKNA